MLQHRYMDQGVCDVKEVSGREICVSEEIIFAELVRIEGSVVYL